MPPYSRLHHAVAAATAARVGAGHRRMRGWTDTERSIDHWHPDQTAHYESIQSQTSAQRHAPWSSAHLG